MRGVELSALLALSATGKNAIQKVEAAAISFRIATKWSH
jgi:hypothetical protein